MIRLLLRLHLISRSRLAVEAVFGILLGTVVGRFPNGYVIVISALFQVVISFVLAGRAVNSQDKNAMKTLRALPLSSRALGGAIWARLVVAPFVWMVLGGMVGVLLRAHIQDVESGYVDAPGSIVGMLLRTHSQAPLTLAVAGIVETFVLGLLFVSWMLCLRLFALLCERQRTLSIKAFLEIILFLLVLVSGFLCFRNGNLFRALPSEWRLLYWQDYVSLAASCVCFLVSYPALVFFAIEGRRAWPVPDSANEPRRKANMVRFAPRSSSCPLLYTAIGEAALGAFLVPVVSFAVAFGYVQAWGVRKTIAAIVDLGRSDNATSAWLLAFSAFLGGTVAAGAVPQWFQGLRAFRSLPISLKRLSFWLLARIALLASSPILMFALALALLGRGFGDLSAMLTILLPLSFALALVGIDLLLYLFPGLVGSDGAIAASCLIPYILLFVCILIGADSGSKFLSITAPGGAVAFIASLLVCAVGAWGFLRVLRAGKRVR